MKRSKQRDAVLQALCSTKTHPTADAVYEEVRKTIPNISLGTVYRNLNSLCENGDAGRLDVGLNHSRFDGNVMPHNHFVCRQCHRVTDVEDEYDKSLDDNADFGGKVEYHTLTFYGVCDICAAASEK